MKIKVKKLLNVKQIPKKDGTGTFPVCNILTEDDEVGDVMGEVKVGDELEGEWEKTQYGMKFKKAYSGGGGGKYGKNNPETQAQIIRQNSLTNAVAYCTAKANLMKKEDGEKYLSGKGIIQVATYFSKYSLGKITVVMTLEEIAKELGYEAKEEKPVVEKEVVTSGDEPTTNELDDYLKED